MTVFIPTIVGNPCLAVLFPWPGYDDDFRIALLQTSDSDDSGACRNLSLGKKTGQFVRARTLSDAVHLILQLGYFKARFRFFHHDPPGVADDLRYIVARHFPDEAPPAVKERVGGRFALLAPERIEIVSLLLKLDLLPRGRSRDAALKAARSCVRSENQQCVLQNASNALSIDSSSAEARALIEHSKVDSDKGHSPLNALSE